MIKTALTVWGFVRVKCNVIHFKDMTMSDLYFVVVSGFTSAFIGLVVKCNGVHILEDQKYYVTCDDSVTFDAIHSDTVKEITKEEYELFAPRNKILYDFAAKIDV